MRSRRALILSAIIVLAHAGAARAQSAPGSLSAEDVAAACAPTLAVAPPAGTGLRIVGAQDTAPRALFGPRDLVVITGGTQAGVQLGQDYFIRRAYAFGGMNMKGRPQTIHTTGWLRIVAVNETTAIAQINTICDGIVAGDYLEPFAPPAPIAAGADPATPVELDFSSLGRVMFGKEERHLGSAGDFMLLEIGNTSLAPGTRVAIYRDLLTPGVPLTAIGEGVVVSMTSGTPLLRITASRDAVRGGDYVVPHK